MTTHASATASLRHGPSAPSRVPRARGPGRGTLALLAVALLLIGGALALLPGSASTASPAPRAASLADASSSSLLVNITANATEGTAPLFAQFTAVVYGGVAPYAYAWSYGNGTYAGNASSAQIEFTSPGNYVVTLTVTDAVGQAGTATLPVTVVKVSGDNLEVSLTVVGGESVGVAPWTVTFAAQAQGGTPPYSYAWGFGAGSDGAVGQNVTQTFVPAGDGCPATNTTCPIWVRVTVTDAQGETNSAMTTVTLLSSLPGNGTAPVSASISASVSSGTAPLTVSFGATTTGIALPTFLWRFGDGSQAGGNSTVQHTYDEAGSYTVDLNVAGLNGTEASASTTVVVYALPPSNGSSSLAPSVQANATSGALPLAVSFEGSATGGSAPYVYDWEFGDGASAVGASVAHTFTVQGTYVVSLLVTDAAGAQATTGVFISAGENASTAASTLTVSVSVLSMTGTAPLTVTFSPAVVGGNGLYTVNWDFGGGGSTVVEDGLLAVTHTYAEAGTYFPEVSVTDSAGAQGSWSSAPSGTDHPVVVDASSTSVPPSTGGGARASVPQVPAWALGTLVAAVLGALVLALVLTRRSRRPPATVASGDLYKEYKVDAGSHGASAEAPSSGGATSQGDPMGDVL